MATPSCTSCFLTVWLLGWTVCVVPFDCVLAASAYQQLRALTFPTADGVVLRSGVAKDDDANRLAIAYEYEVDGQYYTGTRYSYAEMGTDSRAWHDVAAELPPDTPVRVWYNPDAPADSLLHPGFTGFNLMMIWFLTPFNAVMIGGWVLLARNRRPAFAPVRTKRGWRVPLPDLGGTVLFLGTLGGIAFAGVFLWAFGFGFNPPVAIAGGLYVAAFAFAAWMGLGHVPPVLEVDDRARVVRLPVGEIPLAAISGVAVSMEDSDTDRSPGSRYRCELTRTDGQPATVRVANYGTEADAAALAAWLRKRLSE